ncbi:MAG: polyisoprenoid-binding protein [Nitrospirae bacterium]|nr:polyisoprenoid-binding protein [Nitrospirota bacterium]
MKKHVVRAVVGILATWGLLLAGSAQADMARYTVDPDHSSIEFQVTHMTVSKTKGRFDDYTGFIEMDPEKLAVKTIEATIQTASLNTYQKKRDEHLRGEDFFNAAKYPTITYKLKSYKKNGDGYAAVGDLTLLGVTKEISLDGSFLGVTKDPWGNTRAGFSAEGKIHRKDFGMVWNKLLDNGGMVVSDDVLIKLDIECIQDKK